MSLELFIDGIDRIEYLIYSSLSIEQRADAFVSTCSFQLVDETASLVIQEKQVVLIRDLTVVPIKYFEGIIANVTSDNLAEGTECLIHTIEAQDYNILVEEVVVDQLLEFGAGTQDNTIIDQIFNAPNNYLVEVDTRAWGAGGHCHHLHIFGGGIDFYAITLREVLDRIATEVESTALEGYWYIDFDKFLHYFNIEDYDPGWALSDTPDYAASFPYLSAIKKDRTGAALVNRILVCGADVDLFVQDQDSHDYYGKWFEGIVRDNTLLGVDEVIDHGNALLAKWAYPDESYEVTTRQPGLRAGMNIEFNNTLFGTAETVNLVENPSFEVNMNFWASINEGGPGMSGRSNVRAAVDTWSAAVMATGAGNNMYLRSGQIAVAAGETITVQARLWRETDFGCDIEIYNETGAASVGTLAPSLDRLETWETLTLSWTNPGGAVNITFRLRNTEGDGASNVWFDACMAVINKGPRPLKYFDGTAQFPYADWDGVAHDSISRRGPVYMIKQLTITWPENTPTWTLTLGGKVTQSALIKARNTNDGVLSGLGPVVDGQVPLASRGWSHDLEFSATDWRTVAWAAGEIITAAGQTFTIAPGANTGPMAADTVHYIYFDADFSLTALRVSAGAAVVGGNVILMAVAVAVPNVATDKARFQVFGGEGIGVFVTADNIAANTITANEISANTITAAEIAANTITAAQIFAGTITATEIAADTIRPTNLLIGGFGDQVFNASDGLLLLGPRNEINTTEWHSLRRQKATLSGAFHQEAGYWLGTKGLVIEEATTNRVTNPSFETNTTDWAAAGSAIARVSTCNRIGGYSLRVITNNGAAFEGAEHVVTANTAAGTEYTFSAYVRGSGTMRVSCWDDVTGYQHGSIVTLTDTWQRATLTATFGVGSTVRALEIRTNVQQNITFYIDAVQVEQQDCATSYCDGSLGTGYAWTGAAHASTSTRTATDVDLDAHAGLVSDNNTMSFRTIVQMPYDHDETWPTSPYVFGVTNAANNQGVLIAYDEGAETFIVWINNAWRFSSAAQTFDAGDWLDIVLTLDFAGNEYYLYINGVESNSDTTALVAPTGLTKWNLGNNTWDGGIGGLNFCEYAAFDRVLTADEAAMLYENNRPIVDAGSIDKPGIYILDGLFKIASSTTGNRIEIDADEIVGYSSAGVKQFYLSSADGVAYAGAGSVWLDASGVTLEAGVGALNQVKWDSGGTIVGLIYGVDTGAAVTQELVLRADAIANTAYGKVILSATGVPVGSNAIIDIKSGKLADNVPKIYFTLGATETVRIVADDVQILGGLYVGQLGVNPDPNDMWCDGEISTSGGTTRWHLSTAVAGAIVPDTKINIEINGTAYQLNAYEV